MSAWAAPPPPGRQTVSQSGRGSRHRSGAGAETPTSAQSLSLSWHLTVKFPGSIPCKQPLNITTPNATPRPGADG